MTTQQSSDPEIINTLEDYLAAEDFSSVLEMLREMHPADQAKLFFSLKPEQREILLKRLEIPEIADIFDELDDKQTLSAARDLPLPFLADIIDDMDPDEAADLLGDLTGQEVRKTISLMEEPEEVLPLLRYPDETAGGRMTTDFLHLKPTDTAEQAIQYLRSTGSETDIPYYLFVMTDKKELLGVIGLRELVCAQPQQPIGDIMADQVISVQAMQDQE
jgi:magnesium transporter